MENHTIMALHVSNDNPDDAKKKGGAISFLYSITPTFKQKKIYKALKITPYPIKLKTIAT